MIDHGRVAVIIPAFNHGVRLSDVVWQVKNLGYPVFVVNDGSTDTTAELLASMDGITVLEHTVNMGKGEALVTGFKAATASCDWAISIDADGQHKPEDVGCLLAAVPADQRPIVIGARLGMDGENVPWTSRFGRGFSNFWVWVSGGPLVSDSQSGFRLYPLPNVLHLDIRSRRFQFEVEVLVKACRAGIPVFEAPVQVVYQKGAERISHFHPWRDFLRNSLTFSRLIFGRIFSIFRWRAR